jgi:hypothetical protein
MEGETMEGVVEDDIETSDETDVMPVAGQDILAQKR